MFGHFEQLPLYSTTYFRAVAQGRGALWVKRCRFSHVSGEGRRINLNFFSHGVKRQPEYMNWVLR